MGRVRVRKLFVALLFFGILSGESRAAAVGDEKHPRLWVDYLWFCPIENSLKYAVENPTFSCYLPDNSVPHPEILPVLQNFAYRPGIRTGIEVPLVKWTLAGSVLIFSPSGPKVDFTAPSAHGGALAILVEPHPGAGSTSLFEQVVAQWNLQLRLWDLWISRTFSFVDLLEISPILGGQWGCVNQNLKVEYITQITYECGMNLIGDYPINTPTEVIAKNLFQGQGPMLGMDARFLFPWGFSLAGTTTISALIGNFDISTVYANLINAPGSTISLPSKFKSVSYVTKIQLALLKKISLGRASLSFGAGVESDHFANQFRLNFFSSTVQPAVLDDLYIFGFYLRAIGSW